MNAESILTNFASGLEKSRAAHAYLVNGPVRRGSMPVAERMAEMVLCSNGQKGCGTCESCRKVANRSHPDLVWIEPKMKSRRISIAEIRALQDVVYHTAYMGDWKVCVVAGADRMGREAANAVLKSLEEPPPNTMFILLAENPQYLLPTIISRCQRFDLSCEARPGDYHWYEELVAGLACAGSGTIDRMSSAYKLVGLLKEIKSGIEAALQEEDDYTDDMDEKVFDARVSARYREERTAVLRMLVLWYRDILLLAAGGQDGDLYHTDYVERIRAASLGLSVRAATANIEIIEDMAALLERNLGEDAVFLDGFARLVEA
jgi:DNA polymerase III delta' subunit